MPGVVRRVDVHVALLVVIAGIPIALVRADVDKRVNPKHRDCRRDADQAQTVVLVDRVQVDVPAADVDRHAGIDLDVLRIDSEARARREVVACEFDRVGSEAAVDHHRGDAGDHEVGQFRDLRTDAERPQVVLDLDAVAGGHAGRSVDVGRDLEHVLVAELGAAREVSAVDGDAPRSSGYGLEPVVRDCRTVEHDRARMGTARIGHEGIALDRQQVVAACAAVDMRNGATLRDVERVVRICRADQRFDVRERYALDCPAPGACDAPDGVRGRAVQRVGTAGAVERDRNGNGARDRERVVTVATGDRDARDIRCGARCRDAVDREDDVAAVGGDRDRVSGAVRERDAPG